jgi:hypothetical protein
MKRSLKATLLAVLGITTFTGVALTSVKVNQPIASHKVEKTNITDSTKKIESYALPVFEQSASIINNKTYLSPDFGLNTSYTTLFLQLKQGITNPIQLSFGGEVADARLPKTKVPIRMPDGNQVWVYAERITTGVGIGGIVKDIVSFFGGKSENVYFVIANDVPIEWGEAWHLCNRQYNSKLVWNNNLKTCVKR